MQALGELLSYVFPLHPWRLLLYHWLTGGLSRGELLKLDFGVPVCLTGVGDIYMELGHLGSGLNGFLSFYAHHAYQFNLNQVDFLQLLI